MAKYDIPRRDGESLKDFRNRYARERDNLIRRAAGVPARDPTRLCSEEGCGLKAVSKGMCAKHYRKVWEKERKPSLPPGKRDHPYYMIWWERRDRGSLCEEWALDFSQFLTDVGERPSDDHLLRPLRWSEPYGPDNFEWLAALKRAPEESRKDFNSRKWDSRRERDPRYEGDRQLKRKYGVTPEAYAKMLKAQGGVCAICEKEETKIDHKTHAPRMLAVDHCRETKKVRGLLCSRCNMTIGAAEHSVQLLKKMIGYLVAADAAVTPPLAEPHKMILQTPAGPLTLLEAARMAGLKPKTVVARIRHGWPEAKWLQPIKKPKYGKDDGEVL